MYCKRTVRLVVFGGKSDGYGQERSLRKRAGPTGLLLFGGHCHRVRRRRSGLPDQRPDGRTHLPGRNCPSDQCRDCSRRLHRDGAGFRAVGDHQGFTYAHVGRGDLP